MSPFDTTCDDAGKGRGSQALNSGRRLRNYRVLAGLSQDEVGRRSGVERSIISRAENGYRALTEGQKRKVAEALEIEPEILFGENN